MRTDPATQKSPDSCSALTPGCSVSVVRNTDSASASRSRRNTSDTSMVASVSAILDEPPTRLAPSASTESVTGIVHARPFSRCMVSRMLR